MCGINVGINVFMLSSDIPLHRSVERIGIAPKRDEYEDDVVACLSGKLLLVYRENNWKVVPQEETRLVWPPAPSTKLKPFPLDSFPDRLAGDNVFEFVQKLRTVDKTVVL